MKYFDTHCHLNSEQLYRDRKQIISDCLKKNIDLILVVGFDYKTSLQAVEIAKEFNCCYASIGIHPTELDSLKKEDEEQFFSLLNHDKVVALGEIGLDYHWVKDSKERERQKEWFIKQIDIANKYHKPIIIHSRDASNDTYQILKEHRPLYGGSMHCYSYSSEMVKLFLNLDLYIGIDGPVTFLNGKNIKEVAKITPLDKLLIETDSPYLSPHPLRGTVNTPLNLPLIVKEIANIKSESEEKICECTYSNGRKLFHV